MMYFPCQICSRMMISYNATEPTNFSDNSFMTIQKSVVHIHAVPTTNTPNLVTFTKMSFEL